MNLESVSVVIPAHNRPEKLRRVLHYYSQTNIHIIVSDSSDASFPYLYEFPKLKYFHFPKEHFLWKINFILPYINTKYVVYCADDDFIVPQGIEQCILFLDAHSDYNSAQGHYLSFETKNDRLDFYPSYIRNFDKDINKNLPSERLVEFRNLYASLLYSVIRATTFVEMYKKCIGGETLKFTNLFLAEIYFNFFSLIVGKNKTLPIFYGAREKDYRSATYSTVPISVIRSSPLYEKEFQSFFNLLVNVLISKQNVEIESAKNLISGLLQDPKKDHISPLKRKLLNLLNVFGPNELVNRYLRHKYKVKGLKITKDMKSYPSTFSTPEKELIVHYISNYH